MPFSRLPIRRSYPCIKGICNPSSGLIIDSWQRHPFLRLLMPLVVGILCGDVFPHVLSAWGVMLAGFLLFLFIIGRYKHTGWVYGAAVYLFLGGTGFCLMSWQQGKTAFPFSGKTAVYRVCIREHPEERERSILCRVALLGEVEKDTVTGCPRNHLFLAYFPKDSATATLRRGDELLVSAGLFLRQTMVIPTSLTMPAT